MYARSTSSEKTRGDDQQVVGLGRHAAKVGENAGVIAPHDFDGHASRRFVGFLGFLKGGHRARILGEHSKAPSDRGELRSGSVRMTGLLG